MRRISLSASLVSLATLFSRILGLGRDVLRATLLGSGLLSDAMEVAFRIPNLLRDLFAEGAFNGAFVPTLSREKKEGGKRAAFELTNRALSTLFLYASGAVALMMIFAPEIVWLITDESFSGDPEKFDPTVRLVRVLAPFLILVSMAAVAMGALNVSGRFFLPALSPATQNLVLVAGGSLMVILGLTEDRALLPWAGLLLLGGAVQFVVQLPALRREGWRPQWRPDVFLKSPGVREIAKRMGPVVLGMAATHLSILINTRLASQFTGGVSYLYYGFRLVHLPVGLIGVAVGTVTLARASEHAAKGDLEGVRTTMGDSLRLCFAFALPATAGLFVLAQPIADLLFRHGATTRLDALFIGETIRVYALAVISYCCVKVMVPVFFALGRVRVPVIASLVAVAANLAVALTLSRDPDWEWRAMALAVGVGQAFNLIVLLIAARRIFPAALSGFLGSLAKTVVATTGCTAAATALLHAMPEPSGFWGLAARALVPTLGGAAAYLALGWALRSEEIRAVLIRRRG